MSTRTQHPAQSEIAAILALHPAGIESKVLAAEVGRNHEAVNELLRKMLSKSMACKWPDRFGPCKWCLPSDLKTAQAAHAAHRVLADKATQARKNRQAAKTRALKAAARLRKTDSEDDATGFYAPPIMRIVRAHEVPPLRPRGPSCVWELAA